MPTVFRTLCQVLGGMVVSLAKPAPPLAESRESQQYKPQAREKRGQCRLGLQRQSERWRGGYIREDLQRPDLREECLREVPATQNYVFSIRERHTQTLLIKWFIGPVPI